MGTVCPSTMEEFKVTYNGNTSMEIAQLKPDISH